MPREKGLLKAVVEKNPSRHAQAESLIAQLELIRVTLSRHANIKALRARVLHLEEHIPDLWRENEKAVLRELESTNPDQLRAEMKGMIEHLREYNVVPVAKYGMAGKAAQHLSHSINKVVIGKAAPAIKAITSVGKQFQLSKLRGSTVLLFFGLNHSSDNDVMYAPLRKLADDYKSRHVEVVMILETDEDRFQSAAALKRHFPRTVIQEPSVGSLSLDWGVRGYPTVFFIDAKGILQSWTVGLPCYDDDSGYDATEVAAELDKLLASKQSHNNDGSKGPIVASNVKPGLSEPLGSNEPQLLPVAEAVKDSAVTLPPIVFDTLEDLMRPAKELFDNEMKQIDERLATVVEGSAEHSLLTTKKKQLQQRWDLSVAQVKGGDRHPFSLIQFQIFPFKPPAACQAEVWVVGSHLPLVAGPLAVLNILMLNRTQNPFPRGRGLSEWKSFDLG